MSWLFSRALVEEYWEASSSDGEPSALSSSTDMPQAYWSPDKTTDALPRFPSGMTCEILTARLGAAVLMSFLEAFPARTYPAPEGGPELPESDLGSGWKWPGSWAKYDPASCSWKIRQCSLLEDSVSFSETWPRWGSMLDGELCPLPTLVLRTEGSGSGYWPTPTVMERGSVGNGELYETSTGSVRRRNSDGTNSNMGLRWSIGGLPNPEWLEWLMGFSMDWTDAERSATDRFRSWLQQHGVCSEGRE